MAGDASKQIECSFPCTMLRRAKVGSTLQQHSVNAIPILSRPNPLLHQLPRCCNSTLNGVPDFNLLFKTRITHQAARLCLGLSVRHHITPAFSSLDWLAVFERTRILLALLTYKARANHLPFYSMPMVTLCSTVIDRFSLRNASAGNKVSCSWNASCLWPAFICSCYSSSIWSSVYLLLFATLLSRLPFPLN